MLNKIQLIVLTPLVLIMVGCAHSFSLTVSVSGRPLTGKAAFPGGNVAECGSTPEEAAMSINGRLFLVSTNHVKWEEGHTADGAMVWRSMDTPAAWKKMVLKQEAAGVVVLVDGHKLATIQ
jgi:hypothetical protein